MFTLLFVSCDNDHAIQKNGALSFESDLESVLIVDIDTVFETSEKDCYLGAANAVSTDFARSGTSSIQLNENTPYGLNCRLENIQPGEFIEVSVWTHESSRDPSLLASQKMTDATYRYRTVSDPTVKPENGWKKHSLSFVVKPGVEQVDICVFSGKKVAYFDDFSIKKLEKAPQNKLSAKLELNVPETAQSTLEGYIDYASNFKSIPPFCKEYVKAKLIQGTDTAKIEMKLKGDWTDHLYSGKESYRIKIKGNHAFEGLKSFSIQHPKSRRYLDEWVIHKMADREDILTTKYDFINSKTNGINTGVYALEEHFDKQLLESRNRREGPILKFDETSFWAVIKKYYPPDSLALWPYFQESPIQVFKKNRTLKSAQLSKQFTEGAKLLHLFKNGHLKLEDIFDIDRLAKFYVLMELSGSTHGLRWHNRRFYYNPVTQKLEHIAFDILPFIRGENFECYVAKQLTDSVSLYEEVFDNSILYHPTFKERYLYHLDQKTKPEYLDTVFNEIDSELNLNLAALQTEYSHYHFNKEIYYKNAAFLRLEMKKLRANWEEIITAKPNLNDWVKPIHFQKRGDDLFFKSLSVNAYVTEKEDHFEVFAENFHLNDVWIHGYQIKTDEKEVVRFEKPLKLAAFTGNTDSVVFSTWHKPRKIYFTVSNSPEQIISKKTIKWKHPKGITTRMQLAREFTVASPYYSVQNGVVIFSGQTIVDRLLLIPDDFPVRVNPGTEIEFVNGGGLIICNQFNAQGTAAQPIRFFGGDTTSNGVTVLNGGTANLSHVTFENLSNLDYKNWELTGAVTFYETETNMSHCEISNNDCEDGLNIIRSNFEIDHLAINNTFSDGFDADFCTGNLRKSAFNHTGNDCIDFSGSRVNIEDIVIHNSGDKGISGGEASKLNLKNITIDGAITGVAAKDGSVIVGDSVSVSGAEYACAAFRKKPEYRAASIDLVRATFYNVQEEILVEVESKITLNGKVYICEERLDIDALYARFE